MPFITKSRREHQPHNPSFAPEAPLVSVIIPTYNGANYITKTIESVFKQEYPAYEIIVVDDGSSDSLQQVLMPYMEKIRYVYQENRGTAAARNRGLELVHGEFVVFLDHDDLLLPHALTDRVKCFLEQPDLGMVNSGRCLINEHGEFIRDSEPWHNTPRLSMEDWLTWSPVLPSAMMFRREWIMRAGGFDPSVSGSDDTDLVWRLALMGCRADWIRKITACYRVHSANQSRQSPDIIQSHIRVVDKFFTQPNLPQRIRRLEQHVRYYSLLWQIWNLYCSGHKDVTIPYLQQSLKYSPFSSSEATVCNWGTYFTNLFIERAYPVTELYAVLPYFKSATNLEERRWAAIEQSLKLWLELWYMYWNREESHSTSYEFVGFQGQTPGQIVEAVQNVLTFSDVVSVKQITRLWRDLRQRGFIPASRRYDVTALHLTLFGQTALRQKWPIAVSSLAAALKLSWHPQAIRAWGQFLRNTITYWRQTSKQTKNDGRI